MNLPTVSFPDHMTYDDRYEYYMVQPTTTVPRRTMKKGWSVVNLSTRSSAAKGPPLFSDRKRKRNDKYWGGPIGSMDVAGMAIMGMCSLM